MLVFVGRIVAMIRAGGPQGSSYNSFINYITCHCIILKGKYQKISKLHTKIIKKIQFFALFSCNFIFLSCWGAAMDPLVGRMRPPGRVFEVPDLELLLSNFHVCINAALQYSKCIKVQTQVQSPISAKNFPMVKSDEG
jgi:hypothetical protein